MQEQASVMASQKGVMVVQTETMQIQADTMIRSLKETQNLVSQNERAVKAAEQTAETTRQALHISERPYLEITNISVSLPFVAETPIIYSTTIENKGRTPAYDVKSAMYIDVRPDPLPENPEYRPLRTITSNVSLGSGNPMSSKQTTNFVLPQDAIDQIYVRKILVYVYGFVTYKDGLTPDIHRTRFCSVFNPEENLFVAIGYHNDAD
ncbi:MAG TPA: hypothetical protein VGN95_01985 [Pyrinomonadaceae bacterium]|nr:hypothetical protein [Pyrinomonadaceae bacterium]